ncbi:MAG TPA: hypothetical protein VJW75_07725 [Candidatus Eisenbacteria bacterium]|nr:hypothetical protein [Candidatus Eisenbacteria bacterium]
MDARFLALLIALAIMNLASAGSSEASILPSSGSLGCGITLDLDRTYQTPAPVPHLAATWLLTSHFALRSTAGYVRERLVRDPDDGSLPGGKVLYSEYFPIGLGLRFYPALSRGRARGFYVDAVPVVYASHIRSYVEPDWGTVTWGYEAGFGARFALWGESRGEIGAMLYHIDGINEKNAYSTSSEWRSFGGLEVYMMRFSAGFGD